MTGIVREARRPDGWIAPGPPPRDLGGRPEPRDGEDLCFLVGDWRIFQRIDGHRWSLDDLLTAWLARREMEGRSVQRVADIGCGIGSVLLMNAWSFPDATVVGVEAQAISAELARRSIAWNGVGGRVSVIDGDLRDPRALDGVAPCDLVTGTPPYFDIHAATQSTLPQRAPCRFEHRGGPEAYLGAAARLLADDGMFCMVVAQAQAARVEQTAPELGLAVRVRLDVEPRAGKADLIAVFALDHGTRPVVRERICIRAADGRFTPEFRAIRAQMGIPSRD